MLFYRRISLFLYFLVWFNGASSQNYPVKKYTAANELPNNAIRSLLVDSNKILWIGTENGVVKKENDEFKYFFEEDGLALNSCWAIAEDQINNLWFGSYGNGVSIFDGYEFKVISEKDGLVHNEITRLFSSGNRMYVGTSDGVSIVDINTFKVISLDVPSEKELLRVQDFFKYKDRIYVVTYSSGTYKIEDNIDRTRLVKVNDHQFIYSVLVDKDSIYSSNKGFFTKTSLPHYLNENDPLPAEALGTSVIWDYIKTRDHRIFAAAWGIYDSNGGIYEVIGDQMIPMASEFDISSKEIISLAYDDIFEKLYVGTKDAGLIEVSLDPQIKFYEVNGENILGYAKTPNSSAVLFHDGIVLKGVGEEKKNHVASTKGMAEKLFVEQKTALTETRE